jgi:small GTP-binding protein
MSSKYQTEYRFKIVIMGPTASGKSSLMHAICNESIPNEHNITIGVDYCAKDINIQNNNYKFCLWDVSGNIAFLPIARSYFHSSIASILVFDLSCSDSFDTAVDWFAKYRQSCPDNYVILVGNKLDKLVKDGNYSHDILTYGNKMSEKIKVFIKNNNLPYLEISAKNRYNVDELLNLISSDFQNMIRHGKLTQEHNTGFQIIEVSRDIFIDCTTDTKKKQITCCNLQ